MNKNEEFTARCTGITDQGFGVFRHDGKTVFAAGLLPGEEARIRIIKLFKKYAIGKCVELLSKSDARTEPVCALAGKCGGCSFQQIRYEDQLKYKHAELEHLFRQVDPDIEVLPVLGMKDPFYYRNKAQFPIAVEDGKVISGFYRPRTNEILDMVECPIQSKEINKIFAWIKATLPASLAEPLRHLLIRSSLKTKEAQVVFIGKTDAGLKDYAQKLARQFPEIVSILFNENEGTDNVILGDHYHVLYGRDFIMEDCLGLKVQLHFKSFFQVNPVQMEVLYTQALEMADLKPSDTVIELYSGTGTIGMLAARQAGSVIGVEIVEEAVKNARENARLNHLDNVEFICEDASKFAAENTSDADVVIVDPPRKGMTEQGIADIVRLSPNRIVYISCNPRTLARDLQSFAKAGYKCQKVQPVDMFPQTAHVETVALMSKL